jgi:kynureninase
MSADPLLRYRRHFPTLRDSVHLISHSLGAMPAGAADRLREFADAWRKDSIEAWHDWLPRVTASGDEIGAIIGAPKGTVVMHQNVSSLMAIVLSSFDFRGPRRTIVSTDMNFPSVHYVLREQERIGATLRLVRSRDRITIDPEAFIAAIDDRTLAVVIELVLFRSGYIQEAKEIVRAARRKGAVTIVDAYQAVGAIPVDVQDLGCDFLMGGSVKWLCGGPGAAYLYARTSATRRFEPRDCGWFSHKRPFAFELGRVDYQPDVRRFMGGTPGVPALYASAEGRRYVRTIGVGAIRRKALRQTGILMELADERGLRVNTPREAARRGNMVCVDFPGAERVHLELLKRRFLIDYRPGSGIRISPHFYTRDDELHAFFEEIDRLRSSTRTRRSKRGP